MSVRSTPTNAAEAGLAIARAMEAEQIPYALGGALALGAHGVPRGTLDVDINVFVEDAALPRLIACLQALGIELELAVALRSAQRDGMFVGQTAGAGLNFGLTRDLSLNVGYEYGEGRYGNGGRVSRTHKADIGLGFARALSLTRRTTLSCRRSTGSAARSRS